MLLKLKFRTVIHLNSVIIISVINKNVTSALDMLKKKSAIDDWHNEYWEKTF